MNKKYQVFLSSTFVDLRDERSIVISTLLDKGDVIPVGMELFPAKNSDPWNHIKTVIEESDYYIVVVAGRYGSRTSENAMSYTEREYRYAKQLGKPIIRFIREKLDALEGDQKKDVGDDWTRLDAFRKEVAQDGMPRWWNHNHELASGVLNGLSHLTKEYPSPGWIRGDGVLDPSRALAIKEENDELRTKLAAIEAQSAVGLPSATDLARGSDPTTLSYKGFTTRGKEGGVATTWDEILTFVGPSLFAPLPDTHFANAISNFIGRKSGDHSITDTWQTANRVKMQFVALGLIHETARKPAPGGALSSLWELTPKGRTYVSMLIAEKRPATTALPSTVATTVAPAATE